MMSATPNSDIPTNILVLSNIVYPVIDQLPSTNELRETFYQLEELYPGFARHFINKFLEDEYPHLKSSSIDTNELTLKIEKFCDKSSYFISTASRNEAEFGELNIRSKNLKFVLSRIPDVIDDKRLFLDTIKEIASAIKKTLDSVANIYPYLTTPDRTQALEIEKKEFIRASKHFSNTLKAFFRDNQRDQVFLAANNLLVQTDYLLRTIRISCEQNPFDESFYPLRCQYQKQLNSNRNSSLINGQSVRSSTTSQRNN